MEHPSHFTCQPQRRIALGNGFFGLGNEEANYKVRVKRTFFSIGFALTEDDELPRRLSGSHVYAFCLQISVQLLSGVSIGKVTALFAVLQPDCYEGRYSSPPFFR